jgi:putative cardiolipin synthase
MPMRAFDQMVAHSGVTDSLTVARELLQQHLDGPFLGNVNAEIMERFVAGSLNLIEAHVEVVQDHPDKVRHKRWRRSYASLEYLMKMVSAAEKEVVIISPYFVPEKQGVDFFATLAKKGVRIVIITNSLASTNHKSVHAVYGRHRKPLLEQGVELYELRPRYESMATDTELTLHSKVLTVDRKRTFVGSFNLDPRSLYLNTELGMAVESEELATDMATSILDLLPDFAYKLRLSRRQRLEWVLQTGGVEEIITTEPRTSFWLRFRTWLTGLLPIEGQL